MVAEQTTTDVTRAPSTDGPRAAATGFVLAILALVALGLGITHFAIADAWLRLQILRAVLILAALGEGLGSIAQAFFARSFAPRNGRPYDPAYHGVVQDFGFYNFAMALLFICAALDPLRSTTVIAVAIVLYALHGFTHILRYLGWYYGGETPVPTRPRQLELRDALPLIAGSTAMVLFFP